MLAHIAIVLVLAGVASAANYTAQVQEVEIPGGSCLSISHRLHPSTQYGVYFENVILPEFGLLCRQSDVLVSNEILTEQACLKAAPAGSEETCQENYANDAASCAAEYDNEQADKFSYFAALDDNTVYSDAAAWAANRSCTNGDGFLYFKNQCRSAITISLKINDSDFTAGTAACTDVADLLGSDDGDGLEKKYIVLAVVLPVLFVLFLLAAIVAFLLMRMRASKRPVEAPVPVRASSQGAKTPPKTVAAAEDPALTAAPAEGARPSSDLLVAAPVAAADAPGAKCGSQTGAVAGQPTAHVRASTEGERGDKNV